MMIIIGKYAAMSIVSVALVAGGAMALRQDTKKPVAVALEAGGAPAATSASNVDDEAKKLHGELADLELELETLNAQLVPLKSSYFTLSNDLTLKRAQLADFELNADESKKLKDDIRAEEKRLADVRAKHRDLAGEAAVVLARLNALRATLNDNQPASPAAVLQRKDEGDEQQQPEGPPPRQTATMGEIKINTAPGTAGITEQDRGALRIERDNVELDYATTEARVSALRDDLRNAIGWMLGTERSVRTIEDEPFVFRKDRGFQVKEEDLPEIKRNLAEELEVARKHVASLREQYEKANRELQALQQKQAELTEKLAAPEAAPRTIRPGDKLQIGVVSARPGRPLEGERLVRPDGTISLGYYGDLHVAGLDRTQIKVKLIEHMRQYLSDEALGLVVADDQGRPRPVSPALSNSVMVDETPSFAEGEVKPGVDETPKSPLGKIPIGAGAMGGGFR